MSKKVKRGGRPNQREMDEKLVLHCRWVQMIWYTK